jgi:hypothetical protein
MPALRAALVLVPPLLADLVRQVLAGRAPHVCVVAEFSDPGRVIDELRGINVDVVLLGSGISRQHAIGALASHTSVVSLSADLSELAGPGGNEHIPFTTDNLIRLLNSLCKDLDPTPPP